jgi:thioredoxin-like negative regulator of GroEL
MKVIHVNSEKDLEKFNKTVKKGKMMVVFVANWCGHCQHLKPIWKKMEKTLKKEKCLKQGIIAMIYSDYKDKINVSSNCAGYPTIKMYKDGKILNEWNGDWTKKGVLEKSARDFFKSSKKSLFKKKRTKSLFKKKRTKKRKKRTKTRKKKN